VSSVLQPATWAAPEIPFRPSASDNMACERTHACSPTLHRLSLHRRNDCTHNKRTSSDAPTVQVRAAGPETGEQPDLQEGHFVNQITYMNTLVHTVLHCFVNNADKHTFINRHYEADPQYRLNFHLPKTTKKNRKLCLSVRVT